MIVPSERPPVRPATERDPRLRDLLRVEVPVDPPAPPVDDGAPPTWRRFVPAAVLALLFASGVTLLVIGTTIVRNSTGGTVVRTTADPSAPGFEALVEPTPTLAVLGVIDDRLETVTVLALPDPDGGGGGLLHVPVTVLVGGPGERGTLAERWDGATPRAVVDAVGDLITSAVVEFAVIDADRWAGLVEPVAPFEVVNPDPVRSGDGATFDVGSIDLAASQVAAYLSGRVEGESERARLVRVEAFWDGWIGAVTEAGDDATAVPGEVETGIGSFVRALASGPLRHVTLPTVSAGADGSLLALDAQVPALIHEIVPFPRSPRPGVRPRLRVLNGTEDTEAARGVAATLTPAGVEVVLVGNAVRLDRAETTVAYRSPADREAAERVRELLGVGSVVVDEAPTDVAEITVTLGADHE